MTDSPKRRWHRFSLRTLFIVVTAFGCWLGWNVHIVRQRQARWNVIATEREAWFRAIAPVLRSDATITSYKTRTVQHASTAMTPIPLIRRLLGDELHLYVERRREEDARRDAQLYPEATVRYYDGRGSSPQWRAAVDAAFGAELDH